MTSAGNDIVSLTAISVTRSKSPEFFARIISKPEEALFKTLDQTALPFEHFVWLAWSVKESAFKYLHRLDNSLVFSPVNFIIETIDIPAGYNLSVFGKDEISRQGLDELVTFNSLIHVKEHKLHARTIIHNEFILSLVNHDADFSHVCWGIKRVGDSSYKYQSAEVRQFALVHLSKTLGLTGLSIEKNQSEVPVIFHDGNELDVPISLSHHAEWVGYSFIVPKRLYH